MQIEDHMLMGVKYQPAEAIGGLITPIVVVLHDTASRLEHGNAARYLQENPRNHSVHFVLERNGAIIQQVPTNRRANHAGRSHYHGRDWVNGFSIGIEIVNPGKMSRVRKGVAAAWFRKTFDMAEYGIRYAETPEHGAGYWMDYTEAQLEAVEQLLYALFAGIPTLSDICAHWYVSPGRKIDTNPLFPLEHIKARVLGRDDMSDPQAQLADDHAKATTDPTEMVQINVPGDALNMRRWPSFNPNVITTLPDGVVVPVERRGAFGGRVWLKVHYGGQEGWIVSSYTVPVTAARGVHGFQIGG